MPRRARMYIPGLPYHVVQRGNNREACFIEPENYQYYLELWQEISRRYGLAVHAYCLMTNHILATPSRENSLSNVMKVVGSRYAQYVKETLIYSSCRRRPASRSLKTLDPGMRRDDDK